MSSNKTISQIGQSLTSPSDRTLVEVELNGQSFKMELGALASYLAARTPSEPQAATPYWINFPDYALDSEAQEVTINAGGRYLEDGQEKFAPNRTLAFAAIQTAGYQRFDAVVLNLSTFQYELIAGEEGEEPTTPGYDERTNLRVTYILISDEGGELQTPPNDHVQNTDTFLDFGGNNQVSAANLKAALSTLGYFAGYFPTEAALTSQPADSFALVGDPLGLYVYDQGTDTWSLPAVDTDAGGPDTGETSGSVSVVKDYILAFNTDLDTPNENRLFFKGPVLNIDWIFDTDITSTAFYGQVSGNAEAGPFADAAALQTWVTDTIISENTLWYLRIIITPAVSASSEILARFEYTKETSE